jgi:dihydropteroate synthase
MMIALSSSRSSATLAGVAVGGAAPVVLMGVLNVSPESFYAGSVSVGADDVRRAAQTMVGAGAGLVDVGALSTAPYGSPPIPEDEEARRLAAAIAALAPGLGVPLSADTSRLAPARAALDAGAAVLNDVSGFADRRVAALAAERGASVILMASPAAARAGGVPVDPSDPLGTVRGCLAESLRRARAAGVRDEHVVLDPGIGFFLDEPDARAAWDARVLAGLADLARLGRPLAIGVSRKSFIGALTGGARPDDRLSGSLAATALAVAAGAALVRTHDVGQTRDAVRVAEAIAATACRDGAPRRGGGP